MNRKPVRFDYGLLLFGLLVVAGVADSDNSYGESGISIDLPLPTKRIRNGLTVNCDTHWVDTNGYRPIKLTFRPVPAPSAITRQIQIKLSSSETFSSQFSNVIRDETDLAEVFEWCAAAGAQFDTAALNATERSLLDQLFANASRVKYGSERPTHWATREALASARTLATRFEVPHASTTGIERKSGVAA